MRNELDLADYKASDVQLYEYLLKNKHLKEDPLKACLLETVVNGEPLSSVLTRNGFLTQKMIIEIMEIIKPESLMDEEVMVPNIDPELLKSLKTMFCAITSSTVYLATMHENSEYVKKCLQKYFPRHLFKFIPCNIEKLESYLERVDTIYYDESSLAERIVRKALQNNVSDIHIIPQYNVYSIMYRYLGVRYIESVGTKEECMQLTARIKDLARMDMTEKRKPQDGGYQLDFNGKKIDLRVSVVPTPEGEYIVIRILDPDKAQYKLEELGINQILEWRKGSSRADGLCLICGPTGSGKTTTLNATLRELDRFGKAIFTIEDPVEYRVPYIGQVNMNENVGLDFARAVKAFMRCDPDIIVVGEIRDLETARNAIKAAETGHLVFATLHTNSIAGAVNRLRDLGVDSYELKYILRAVMAQRLVRTLCTNCKGAGCEACFNKGYAGRSTISEIKYFSGLNDVLDIIVSNETEVKVSWTTMLEDGIKKVKEGITTPEELVRIFGFEAEEKLNEFGLEVDHMKV